MTSVRWLLAEVQRPGFWRNLGGSVVAMLVLVALASHDAITMWLLRWVSYWNFLPFEWSWWAFLHSVA